MRRYICVFLCVILCACGIPLSVYAESPVIQGVSEGQTLYGDIPICWRAVSGAEYYTVALRYIQNSDS